MSYCSLLFYYYNILFLQNEEICYNNMVSEMISMKKAVLVGVNINNEEDFEESLKELKGLAKACDFKVVGYLTQNLKSPNKKFYIGEGKIESLKIFASEHDADVVIFNNELSPLQFKNLEDELKIEVVDRTLLILNIFASRAKTKEAKLQVEVARLNYLLPRLVVTNASYEQQGGGSLHNRGSGEKQIDIDKRIVRTRIAQLEKELDNLEQNRVTQSKKRNKTDIPLVSIVGYTNAGKSTLMNAFIEEFGNVDNKYVCSSISLFIVADAKYFLPFLSHLSSCSANCLLTIIHAFSNVNIVTSSFEISYIRLSCP